MPRQIAAAVNHGDDVTPLATNFVDDPVGPHENFAEVVDAKLRNHPTGADSQAELARSFIDSLPHSQRIAWGITGDIVHNLFEIFYCRVSPYDAAH
jgi:hypothetical protein